MPVLLGGFRSDRARRCTIGSRHLWRPARNLSQRIAWPAASAKYSTASPLNGGLNVWEDDPAPIASPAVATPVDGLNHSTESFLDPGIAERFTENGPPAGA